MNISNKLTLFRLVLAFLMTIFLTFSIPFGKTLALLVFGLAAYTDFWDGKIARRQSKVTSFGQLMDPLADKIMVCAVFISFVALDQVVPAWIVVIIIMREFLVTGLRLIAATQGRAIPAGRFGKQKTVWQITAILIILAGLALRSDFLPLYMQPEVLRHFLIQYNLYFGYLTYNISLLIAILTVASGTFYFLGCRNWIMKDA